VEGAAHRRAAVGDLLPGQLHDAVVGRDDRNQPTTDRPARTITRIVAIEGL
jgi:hypothetical protein